MFERKMVSDKDFVALFDCMNSVGIPHNTTSSTCSRKTR